MKKFLLSLMVALISATMWNTVSARYIQSDRIPSNEIKAGDTIAMEGGTMSGNHDWFLAVSEDNKLTNLQGFSSRCAWVVSEGPLNCLGLKTFYLQNVATGHFFAGSKLDPQANGSGGFTLNKEIEYALPFCIYSAADSTTVNETYGPIWDENSAVFCFLQDQYADKYEAKYRNFICNCAYWGSGNVFSWGEYYDTNAWNVYRVMYQHDLQGDLQAMIDEISEAGIDYEAGTEPGLYPEDKVKAFNDALEYALLMSMEEHTDAEYQQAMDSLRNAKEAVENSVNPIIEGYYYVVSAFPGYLNKQGVEKAWNANSATQVGWATFNYLNPSQIFKFTPLPSGNFYIQNYDNEQYVNAPETAGSSHKLLFSAQPGYEQIAKPIGSLQWIFYSTFSNITYHTESHQEGSGNAGDLVTWSDNVINSKNAWYIRLVPDSVMEKIPAIKAQAALDAQLKALATEANALYDNLVVYKVDTLGLITNATDGDEANQVSSNAKDPAEGTYAALIDGKTSIFHSTWHVDNDPLTKPHNLQFNLSANPTSGFEMVLLQRCDSWGTQDRPTIVNFYATNDPTDEESWEFIRQVDISKSYGNKDNYQNWAKTPIIDLGKEYSHVRMDVLATNNNRKNSGAQYPFFSLAELQMYPVVLDQELSQYCYTPGLAEKADAMLALALAALDKVNTQTSTAEDVDALRKAITAVKGLYADTTDVANLANTLQNYVTTAVFGDGIGQTTPEAAATLQAAINEAKGSSFTTPLVKAEVDAAMNKLIDARNAFMATVKMPEPGKWYFILSASQVETHYNGGDQDDPLPMANSALYADGPGTGDHIRYGLLTEEREPNYTYNPNAMWRLVEFDGTDKYALQCLGTGQYMGNGNIKIQSSIYTSQTPVLYSIDLLGNASFSLIPEANEYTDYGLVACLKGQHAEVNVPVVYGDGSWKFVEINPEETELLVINSFANNLIDVMAMPYDISYLGDYNDDVHTYGIKKMTLDKATNVTTVELYEKEEVKAGESCIIILGNPAEECEANELVIPFPTEVVDRAFPVNGIQGMLFSEKSAPGSAYSTGNEFVVSADGVGIGANTGAIDASLYKGEVAGVETAYTFTIAGLVWPEAPETAGDVNMDGSVNAADVVAIYNYIADGAESGVSEALADVNADGTVSAADVVKIYSIISGDAANSKGFVEAIVEDGDNQVARLSAAIGNSDDLTAVPVTVFLNNSIDIVAAEYVVVAPVAPAKFVYDEEEEDYMIANTDRWSKGHNAVMIPGTALHGQDGFFVSITDSKNRAFAGTEGSIATVYFDATGLADGDYEVTVKDGIAVTKATDTYKTADMTLKFVIAGGKATGLSTITAEQIAAAKSITTIDGQAVATPVKGNIYVVDGAVVKY